MRAEPTPRLLGVVAPEGAAGGLELPAPTSSPENEESPCDAGAFTGGLLTNTRCTAERQGPVLAEPRLILPVQPRDPPAGIELPHHRCPVFGLAASAPPRLTRRSLLPTVIWAVTKARDLQPQVHLAFTNAMKPPGLAVDHAKERINPRRDHAT